MDLPGDSSVDSFAGLSPVDSTLTDGLTVDFTGLLAPLSQLAIKAELPASFFKAAALQINFVIIMYFIKIKIVLQRLYCTTKSFNFGDIIFYVTVLYCN